MSILVRNACFQRNLLRKRARFDESLPIIGIVDYLPRRGSPKTMVSNDLSDVCVQVFKGAGIPKQFKQPAGDRIGVPTATKCLTAGRGRDLTRDYACMHRWFRIRNWRLHTKRLILVLQSRSGELAFPGRADCGASTLCPGACRGWRNLSKKLCHSGSMCGPDA